jgi:stage V sporulation protein B
LTENTNLGNKKLSSKGGFVSGVAVLTAATVLVKLIGVLYKIPMLKLLGEDGMGYFNSAYEIYTFFYIIASTGLPVAVSILVAQNAERGSRKNAKRIFGVSLALLSALGAAGTAVLYIGADAFGEMIGNSGAAASVRAIAPMAFFVCVSGAVRGYFQGRQNMTPTAVSQIIEAVGKLFPGFLFALLAIRSGSDIESAAAYATVGISLGFGAAMLYLLVSKMLCAESTEPSVAIPTEESKGYIFKRLVAIALPITVSSAVLSMTRVVDLVMILRRLQSIGYTEEAANSIYGSYSTLAVSMFNLPASLVTPIALTLVPLLASAINGGNKTKEANTVNASFKLCGMIIIPSSLGLSVFSRPILSLVFGEETAAVSIASPLLSVLAISVFFSCLITVSNAVLQAYGNERKPIVSMTCGAVVKIFLSYALIGAPTINAYGAPLSTLACDIAISCINIVCIRKTTTCLKSASELFGRSLLAAVVAVGGSAVGYYGLTGAGIIKASGGATALALLIAAVLYAVLSLRMRVVDADEIRLLPQGEKIYEAMKKIKLAK